jgi:Sodium/hydrogen exchanger family
MMSHFYIYFLLAAFCRGTDIPMEQQEISIIESSESYQLKNSDETVSNETLSSNWSTSAGGSVHANNLITPAWDSHIKDLEHLLEVDLERVEIDALDASIHPSSKTGNGTLADDLLHVRQDIDRLVASIKDVEIELGKTKHKIDEEGEHVHQMNAQMEAERFLDGLHRGKLPVRVDYETGELVSRTKSIADRRQQRKRQRMKVNLTNETASIDMINSTTRVNIQRENEEQLSLESQPSRLDEWNEFVLAGTKTGSMDEDDEFSGKKKKLALETVRQHIESHPDMKYRIQEEMEFLKSGSDPAVLSFDTHLMLDIVKLAMTASLFGLGAVFLKLPPTAGFLLGGMLIGPSCLDLLGEIHQVQTLAQFGVIFLLFEQGLLYALTYSEDASSFQSSNQVHPPHVTSQLVSRSAEEGCNITPKPSPRRETKIHSRVFSPKHHSSKGMFLPTLLTRAPSFLDATDEHDPTIVGSIILTLLVFVGLAIVFFTKVANSLLEAIMVSCTIAICSTTIVAESLLSAHISDTPWGIGVLKMVVSVTSIDQIIDFF